MSADVVVAGIAKWLTQTVRLGAIIFFLFCAYEGVFKGGGSTIVFIGVLALSFTLILSHFLEQLPKAYKR